MRSRMYEAAAFLILVPFLVAAVARDIYRTVRRPDVRRRISAFAEGTTQFTVLVLALALVIGPMLVTTWV